MPLTEVVLIEVLRHIQLVLHTQAELDVHLVRVHIVHIDHQADASHHSRKVTLADTLQAALLHMVHHIQHDQLERLFDGEILLQLQAHLHTALHIHHTAQA